MVATRPDDVTPPSRPAPSPYYRPTDRFVGAHNPPRNRPSSTAYAFSLFPQWPRFFQFTVHSTLGLIFYRFSLTCSFRDPLGVSHFGHWTHHDWLINHEMTGLILVTCF